MSEPDLTVINKLTEIRERWELGEKWQVSEWASLSPRISYLYWEAADEDRGFLLELVGKLQEAVMNLAIELVQAERHAHDEINKIAAMNYEAGVSEGAYEQWSAHHE